MEMGASFYIPKFIWELDVLVKPHTLGIHHLLGWIIETWVQRVYVNKV